MALKYPSLMLISAALLLAGMLAATACAAVYFQLEGAGSSYGPGTQYLDANVTVKYNEFIPKDTADLYVYFNGESVPRSQVSLYNYLHDESYYTFQNQTFNYNLTAGGTIGWYEYPTQNFFYWVSVEGLCGGEFCSPYCQCTCDPPYPCKWTISRTGYDEGSVNGDPVLTGLKFIEDASGSGIPLDAVNGTVVWKVQKSGSSPSEVDVDMRAACGRKSTPYPFYDSQSVWESGWIIRSISTPLKPCTEYTGFDCKVTIMPFDDASMSYGYTRFGGPPAGYPGGGIYKTDEFVTNQYQSRGTDVEWNGTTGEIILKNFRSDKYYYAVYLPPNGPLVCAYTGYKVPQSSPWSGSYEIKGASAGYLKPYVRSFALGELESISELEPPDCPIPPESQHMCDKSDKTYGAVESYDPSDSVEVSFDEPTLTVTGTVNRKVFTGNESFRIDFSLFSIDISDLTQSIGNHTMTLAISDGATVYGEQQFSIFTCADSDGDGYCTENGDCNDTNPGQHPDMPEACNGIDDDCDGLVDEGIVGMGEQLGKPCYDWNGSVCKGTYVCNLNGTGLACVPESGIYPGQRQEVCRNGMDDDCDGAIDEKAGDVIDGVTQPACTDEAVWCIEGQTRPCGACRDGTSRCVNGVWQTCQGGSSPETEVCNGEDDDCDGVIDNVGGKESVEDTRCRCYGGGSPLSSELCNDIDDNCNGLVDDGATNCCTEGNTRTCGTDVGACEFGIQTCQGGRWGACTGSVNPEEEICCNGLDDDCNGEVDDLCPRTACDQANQMGMIYWVMMGMGVIIVIGVIIYMEFIKKKPPESAYQQA